MNTLATVQHTHAVSHRYLRQLRPTQIILALALISMFAANASASCVVLLHGLIRSPSAMNKMADTLRSDGFTVVNQGYPSRRHTIDILANLAIPPALQQCPEDETIHFVTHSLGGILVRQYLSTNQIEKLGRVVMMGPPNNGSEVVDELAGFPGFKLINGEAGLQLGTGVDSVPNLLGPATYDVGIIAGDRSINWILSTIIPGTDDGKVSVASSRLKGMRDHIVMPVTHPFMMKNDSVIKQVIFYLKNGKFRRT